MAVSLGGSERSDLNAIVSGAMSGINTLVTGVSNDITIAAVQSDATAMVVNYRVIAVVSPQVTALIASDATLAKALNLASLKSGINAAIVASRQAHRNVTGAVAAYNDLVSQLSQITTTLPGDVVALLALTPSSYPQSKTIVSTASQDQSAASSALTAAQHDVNTIARLLANSAAGTS